MSGHTLQTWLRNKKDIKLKFSHCREFACVDIQLDKYPHLLNAEWLLTFTAATPSGRFSKHVNVLSQCVWLIEAFEKVHEQVVPAEHFSV